MQCLIPKLLWLRGQKSTAVRHTAIPAAKQRHLSAPRLHHHSAMSCDRHCHPLIRVSFSDHAARLVPRALRIEAAVAAAVEDQRHVDACLRTQLSLEDVAAVASARSPDGVTVKPCDVRAVTKGWRRTAFAGAVTRHHHESARFLPTYMYFQTMVTRHHSLEQNRPPQLKHRGHLPAADARLVEHELAVLSHRRMSYSADDLIHRPHGSSPMRDKASFDKALDFYEVPHVTIHNGGNRGVVDLVDTFGMFVLFPNYSKYRLVPDIDGGEDAVLHYALTTSNKLVTDKSRGGEGCDDVFNKRIRWGIGQIQQIGRCDNRQYSARKNHISVGQGGSSDYVSLPTMTAEAYLEMPPRAMQFIKNIAEFGQKSLRRFHGKSALGNARRNKLFSRQLNSLMGHPDMLANFEYYDIVVTDSDAELKRHMDYCNDWRRNYNHTFIHSFFREINGKVYKVSIIMTTRRDAEATVDRLFPVGGHGQVVG